MLFPKIFHIFVTMDKTQNFINKSLKVHGDRYDYSKVEYKNGDTKVCVICKKHGEFWVTPKNHLKGRNCPKCAIEGRSRKRSKTTNEFIEEAVPLMRSVVILVQPHDIHIVISGIPFHILLCRMDPAVG